MSLHCLEKTAFIYQKSRLRAEFFVNYSGAKDFEDLAPSERLETVIFTEDGALGWYTLNLRASYNISEAFSINASVENLSDKHYRTFSSGISAPGINGIITLRTNF